MLKHTFILLLPTTTAWMSYFHPLCNSGLCARIPHSLLRHAPLHKAALSGAWWRWRGLTLPGPLLWCSGAALKGWRKAACSWATLGACLLLLNPLWEVTGGVRDLPQSKAAVTKHCWPTEQSSVQEIESVIFININQTLPCEKNPKTIVSTQAMFSGRTQPSTAYQGLLCLSLCTN